MPWQTTVAIVVPITFTTVMFFLGWVITARIGSKTSLLITRELKGDFRAIIETIGETIAQDGAETRLSIDHATKLRVCPSCGTQIPHAAAYCSNCGKAPGQ